MTGGHAALMIVMLGACGAQARWQQPETADAIRFENDLVIREEEDGSVSLLAMVQLEDDWAAGFVRFRDRATFEREAKSAVTFARMRAWQTMAKRLEAQPERSYRAAFEGITVGRACDFGAITRPLMGYRTDANFPTAERAPLARDALEALIRHCLKREYPDVR